MKYYLFTAPHRCPPCRRLEVMLESTSNWKDKIEYINADAMSEEQHTLAQILGISKLPTLATDTEIIRGDLTELTYKIHKVCTSE